MRRIRITTLISYYAGMLILIALLTLFTTFTPLVLSFYIDILFMILYLYLLMRFRGGLNIGGLYILVIFLILLISLISIFIIRPSVYLHAALSIMRINPIKGFMYVLMYLFLSLLPDSASDFVGTLPVFLLLTAIAILEIKLREYVISSVISGIVGIGVSTLILSLLYNQVIVTYGLSAPTMGLMGYLLIHSLKGIFKGGGRFIHFVNLLIILYTIYKSLFLLTPIPPVIVINGLAVNTLGHFISFAIGFLLAIIIP